MKQLPVVLVLLFISVVNCPGQRSISGKVTDIGGEPLPGAGILVKGSTVGTATDEQGNYRLNLPEDGSILVFTYLGFSSKEIPVGSSDTINVSLEEGVYLDEAIVTALGIERSEKSIPYAVQQIEREDLTISRNFSLVNLLAGKVAGVQILSSPGTKLGYGSGIQIRGAGSLNGPGGPVYIVDGTPSWGIPSIDDIESVTVLKGPNATALYGQRGDQGAIVITTRKGTKNRGIGIEINQSTFLDRLYLLPRYQNLYAGGASPELIPFRWKNGMPEEWKIFEGKYHHDYSDDSSWGPRMEGQEYIPWYAWYPGTEVFGQTAKLSPQPDNVRDFYETGLSLYNNINFQSAGQGYNMRASFTNQRLKGLIPHTSKDDYFLNTNTSFDLGKFIKLGININYRTEESKGGGFNYSESWPFNQTNTSFNQWFHRHLDMRMLKRLRNMRSPEGILASWNHNNPDAYLNSPKDFYAANYWYNFYSYLDFRENINKGVSLNGNVNLSFLLSDKFQVAGIIRRNQFNSQSEDKVYNILEQSAVQTNIQNSYSSSLSDYQEDNYELLATFRDRWGTSLSVEANAGGNIRLELSKDIYAYTSQGLNIPDLFTAANSKATFAPSEYRRRKEVRSLYARGSFGFRDMVYIDWSGRNDWSSALPANRNSYFYPSLGLSFVFSELTGNLLSFLDYGKLRASWAQVGSDLGPYQLGLNYFVDSRQWNGNFLMYTPNTLIDPQIRPSLSSSYEAGLDLKMLDNRLSLNATYFNEKKVDEILSVGITWASGFSDKLINAGRIDRWGWELQLEGVPVKSASFSWELKLNLGRSRNKIVELTEGIDKEVSGNTSYALVKEVGGEWGQLRGGGIKRDEQGRPVLSNDGLYIPQPNTYLGTLLPDFTGGLINSLTYKDLELAFVIDFSKGGNYYSISDHAGVFSGLLARTAAVNDLGKNVRDPVSEGGGVRVDGVNEEGNPATVYVPAFDYYHQFNARQILEPFVFDRSFVKLRELSLSYRVPVRRLGLGALLQQATVALVARNPWLIYAKNRDFDPSEATGWTTEFSQFPNTRSFGLNVKLNF